MSWVDRIFDFHDKVFKTVTGIDLKEVSENNVRVADSQDAGEENAEEDDSN